MSNHLNILIVGAGSMTQAYFKILQSLDISPVVICRTQNTADSFLEKTGHPATPGGLQLWLKNHPIDASWKVIVATPVENLYENLIDLLESGAKDILVEKPGFLYEHQGQKILEIAKNLQAKVHIAYNRRFYASVFAAQKIIENDGGLQSVHFEFTEWAHIIEGIKKGDGVKEKWFLANSTHVVDLVFHLAGIPVEYQFKTFGTLSWHPSAALFIGSGVTDRQIPFTYHSNWEAPGRWAIEMMTKEHRIYLKPMEKLNIQKKGSVAVVEFEIDETLDLEYKPGLYKMVKSFINDDYDLLVSIEQQMQLYKIYQQIANYRD